MAKESAEPAESCPVDPATRAAWLKANPGLTRPGASGSSPANSATPSPIDRSASKTTSPGFFSRLFWSSSNDDTQPSPPKDSLGTERVVSSIPRADNAKDPFSTPANNEQESGVSSAGNWIYPSEKMFFEAMKRKGHDPQGPDMRTIVPIHNAVNERAWREIKEWERPYGSEEQCGGPRLESFMGQSKAITPKARINMLLGYTAPFDRHDWVIDRCGTRVEYVIDFYSGKDEGKAGKLNFFLDVRPKLNTWEGCRMRASKILGLA